MQIAILLFDRFTVLDAISPYQMLSGLPGARVTFVAERPGPIRDEVGSLILSAEAGLPDMPHPDIIVVPGGPGQGGQMQDGQMQDGPDVGLGGRGEDEVLRPPGPWRPG